MAVLIPIANEPPRESLASLVILESAHRWSGVVMIKLAVVLIRRPMRVFGASSECIAADCAVGDDGFRSALLGVGILIGV